MGDIECGNIQTETITDSVNLLSNDAEEYVASVLSGNSLTLRTPLLTNRKRRRRNSMPDESQIKRVRNGSGEILNLDSRKAKRKLTSDDNDKNPDALVISQEDTASEKPKDRCEPQVKRKVKPNKGRKNGKHRTSDSPSIDTEILVTNADIHKEDEVCDTRDLILKMHADMANKFSQINLKIENLEHKLEQKLTQKLNKSLDKRMNTETNNLRSEINQKVNDCRSDLQKEINMLSDQLQGLVTSQSVGEDQSDQNRSNMTRKKNIVIRKLPEGVNENLQMKVRNLIKDGLKLSDINVLSSERKSSRNIDVPGVVIVRLSSEEDKDRIMSVKSKLKDTKQYEKVYIHSDKSRAERLMSSNFRSLVNAYTKGEKVYVQGARVARELVGEQKNDVRCESRCDKPRLGCNEANSGDRYRRSSDNYANRGYVDSYASQQVRNQYGKSHSKHDSHYRMTDSYSFQGKKSNSTESSRDYDFRIDSHENNNKRTYYSQTRHRNDSNYQRSNIDRQHDNRDDQRNRIRGRY